MRNRALLTLCSGGPGSDSSCFTQAGAALYSLRVLSQLCPASYPMQWAGGGALVTEKCYEFREPRSNKEVEPALQEPPKIFETQKEIFHRLPKPKVKTAKPKLISV